MGLGFRASPKNWDDRNFTGIWGQEFRFEGFGLWA